MALTKVFKRDGGVVAFDSGKVNRSVSMAFKAAKKGEDDARVIAGQVVLRLERKFENAVPKVEDVEELILTVLGDYGFPEVASAFLKFRDKKLGGKKEGGGVKRELGLSYNGLAVLQKRYLKKNEKGEVIETPVQMFQRVANNLAEVESKYGKKGGEDVKKLSSQFFGLMSRFEFLPNSPTLMNAGNVLQQLSACFVLPVEDSLSSIFDSVKNAALIHQSGGGTGFNFSHLRPAGDFVNSTAGVASGPVSFIRVFNVATDVVKQGSKRRGANMGILNFNHPDIVDFVNSKKDSRDFANFNFSVSASDDFMKSVEKGSRDFDLINPRTKKAIAKINSKELFDLICKNALNGGDPGLIFIDEVNRRHPLKKIGLIESTNPCGEVDLLPFESCNLGSINLVKMLKKVETKNKAKQAKKQKKELPKQYNQKFELDWKKFEETIKLSVRLLDNVIDASKFPIKQSEEITRANRKIGLGIMGFADLLTYLEVPYDSARALQIADRIMKFLQKAGEKASFELAKERGSFPNFDKSEWKKKYKKFRNGTVSTIAPTGTISIIAGCSSGIEPLFAIAFVRNVLDGQKLLEVNGHFEEIAKYEGFYSRDLMVEIARRGSIRDISGIPDKWKKIFVTAFEVDPLHHVKVQAVFQKYCDNSVSKTINLPSNASIDVVKNIYLAAFKLKCKGITVYRYGSKSDQVLTIGSLESDKTKDKIVEAQPEFAGGCPGPTCTL